MNVSEPVFESIDYYTAAEFSRWLAQQEARGDEHDYELLNGRIVMIPPAGWPHGSCESLLIAAFQQFVRARELGRVFGSSQGFELPSGDVVAPDLSFVSRERWEKAPPPARGEFLHLTPDLVVEILSTRTASRDRGEKRAIYERNGVREYLLVDPLLERVTVLSLEGQRYGGPEVFEADQAARSRLLAGLELSVAELFS